MNGRTIEGSDNLYPFEALLTCGVESCPRGWPR